MTNIKEILRENAVKYAWQSAVLDVEMLDFTEEVRNACKANYCGRYGKCWTCPPGAGEVGVLAERLRKFKYVFVFTTKHELEDEFDYEGMKTAAAEHKRLEKLIIKDIDPKIIKVLGAGSCSICEQCTYPDAPCRFPDKAQPSVEACGIDVVALAAKASINYINGKDTVTYFSVVFYNE